MMQPTTFPQWIYDGSPIEDPMGYGERAVEFFRRLKHPKSRLPRRAFQLDPWQERIVRRVYGPRNEDGSRIVSTVVMLLPRGNRKTAFAAPLALLHTIGPERVPNGEAIFAASDRGQAGIAFKEALGIVRADRRILSRLKVHDAHNSPKKLIYPRDGSTLEVVSSDAGAQHGRTPTFVLADELHVWPNKYLWEALTTGLDKTDNALLIVATTAGRGQENIAWEIVNSARKVARGEIDDPSILPILFESDKDCDYTDEANWRRVNPGSAHGYPSIKGYLRHVGRARTSPGERDSLRQLKLNVWLDNSTSPFVDMAIYDKGNRPLPSDLDGLPCWIGVDMSATTDLTAVVACVRKHDDFFILPHFFCPADNLRARADRDKVDYPEWAERGFITPTPGNVIDYSAVETCIRTLCDRFDVREIGFDAALAQPVMGPLTDDGLPTVTISQKWDIQTPALRDLEKIILEGRFIHGGNPILRWNFANVAVHHWGNDNRSFRKDKSTDRIDGAVASWMAVSRAVAGDGVSYYDSDQWSPQNGYF